MHTKDNFVCAILFLILTFCFCRFLATLSSKRGKRKLVNGRFHCPRWLKHPKIPFFNLYYLSNLYSFLVMNFLLALVLCHLVQVRPVAEDEMFRVIRSGKRKSKYWFSLFVTWNMLNEKALFWMFIKLLISAFI